MFEYYDNMKETTKKILDDFVSEMKNSGNKTKLELSLRRVLDTLNDMASIFLPEDNLLNSAGTLPVYYWFVRSLKESISICKKIHSRV